MKEITKQYATKDYYRPIKTDFRNTGHDGNWWNMLEGTAHKCLLLDGVLEMAAIRKKEQFSKASVKYEF